MSKINEKQARGRFWWAALAIGVLYSLGTTFLGPLSGVPWIIGLLVMGAGMSLVFYLAERWVFKSDVENDKETT